MWHTDDMNRQAQTQSLQMRIQYGIAALLVFIALPVEAWASENRTLSLEEGRHGRMTIAAMINGQSTQALVDTGATIPLIDMVYLGNEEEPVDSMPSINILGVGGHREYRRGAIDELQIGGDYWINLTAAVDDEQREPVLQPILPINLFDARVVDFDFARQKLHLYNGKPRRPRNAIQSTLKYEIINNLMFVDVEINGVKGKALIDTGADVTFMTKAFAREANGRIDEELTQRIRGSDLKANTAEYRVLRNFQVGDMLIEKVMLPALNTELFQALGVDHEYCMVLGMDYLQFYRLQIDRKREEVRLGYVEHSRASLAKRGNPARSMTSIRRR